MTDKCDICIKTFLPTALNITPFIKSGGVILDVRTPNEFEQGHIPGAINLPLFSNEERVVVGTIYKQEGKQPAIVKGLEFVGPKMADLVVQANALVKNNTLYIHCWRGGMRSGSVAWLLEQYGLKIFTLQGGYKQFRNFVLSSFKKEYLFYVLGGKTGSAKTLILNTLLKNGEQIIDLEKLAAHKGSAFGSLGEKKQPTQEQFENELAICLETLDNSKKTWLEDESRLIGNKVIPGTLWEQIRKAKTICLKLPLEERINYLLQEYGVFSATLLKESILKITKRLGHQQTKNALHALEEGNLQKTCEICLSYYDKSYDHGIAQRDQTSVDPISFEKLDSDFIAKALLKLYTNGND